MKQKHLLPFFHRSRKSTVNSMSFSKRKQKCCQYFSSTAKELTEYIVLYFTQVFKRVSCWKASLEGHCQVLQPLKKMVNSLCLHWVMGRGIFCLAVSLHSQTVLPQLISLALASKKIFCISVSAKRYLPCVLPPQKSLRSGGKQTFLILSLWAH